MKSIYLNFSLRSKLVLAVTFAVIAVSCFILYFTVNMIVGDKKAYIYDSVYQSLNTGTSSLEQFFTGKSNFVKVLNPQERAPDDFSQEQLAVDGDHFQLVSIKMNIPREEREVHTIYRNEKFLEFYRKRESFLDLDKRFLFASAEEAKVRGYVEKLFYKEGKAARFVVLAYNSSLDVVYYFDFLLDKIYSDSFDRQSLENKLVSSSGEILFNNRSYEDSGDSTDFYKKFIEDQMERSTGPEMSGVVEQAINGNEYILGFKRIKRFPRSDYFIFTGVKTRDAYQVTTSLVLNTLVYTLFLVGSFNLLSILIVKSITKPLEVLTNNVKIISEGRYNIKFQDQTTFEFKLLVEAFKEMVDKIQSYQNKLIEYNKNLELKVQERTHDLKQANDFIKTMVDSLAQGLLVFDREGTCLDLHTKACEKLIGMDPTGQPLAKLIKAEDESVFNIWVDNLFEEMIPFESLVELGQKSIPCNTDYKSSDFRHITLQFFPMRDDENLIKNVVMVASDETREFKAFKEVEAQQNFAKLVSKVLKDKNSFVRFLKLFEESLANEKEIIQRQGVTSKDDFMRLLHSMKGSAAFYSMADVVKQLHGFENDLLQGDLPVEGIISRIDDVLQTMHESIVVLKDFVNGNGKQTIEIEEGQLREYIEEIKQTNPKIANQLTNKFFNKEVKEYVEKYVSLVSDLSLKLNKATRPVVIENGEFMVDRNHYQDFFDSCVHIFRNVVDHGIELPEVRVSNGKDEEGQIKVSFSTLNAGTESCLVFCVQDDGAGIDASRIRQKMKELNYPEEVISKKDDQVIYHIFDANFSTSQEVTDLSGRGVGLFDIKKNVEKLGGSIELQTKIGKGTLFSFILPIPVAPEQVS